MDNTNNRMHSLIYESGETGHRSEYVSHLMNYIILKPELHGKYTFILNERIKNKVGQLTQQSKAFKVRYIDFGNKKYRNSIERSFSEWKLVSKTIEKDDYFNEIVFLDIDPFLILLTTKQFKRFNLSVRGILFEPYSHFKEKKGSPWFYVRHILRSYVFQRYSTYSNPNIHKLFILNDKQCIPDMNREIKDVFCFLPDPIDNEEKQVSPDMVKRTIAKYGIKTNKKNLLLFGSIDCRKNLINIINSLLLLPKAVKKEIHLVIAGKFHSDSREKYLAHLNKNAGEISVVFFDEFVSDEEREVLFQQCDLVLMPYTNFYSSSGILGHTIKHNKTVVASNAGLVGRLVTENKLGLTVNPLDQREIKDAIISILNKNNTYQYNGKKLLKDYNPENFSKTLLLA